jgi:hypothetical protein
VFLAQIAQRTEFRCFGGMVRDLWNFVDSAAYLLAGYGDGPKLKFIVTSQANFMRNAFPVPSRFSPVRQRRYPTEFFCGQKKLLTQLPVLLLFSITPWALQIDSSPFRSYLLYFEEVARRVLFCIYSIEAS